MTILGEWTEQLDIFWRVTVFTRDFLSFIDVELIWFFHGALQLLMLICQDGEVDISKLSNEKMWYVAAVK